MSVSPMYVPPFVRVLRDLGVPLSAARAADDEIDDEVDAESDAEGDTNAHSDDHGDRRDLPSARALVREGLPRRLRQLRLLNKKIRA